MMRTLALACLSCALIFTIGCGPDSRDDHPTTPTIRIEPADVSVEIVDGVAVVQDYTATLVMPDGSKSDVTNRAVFTVQDGAFGSWAGPSLTVTGGAAGPTRVIATTTEAMGDTGLTVYVKGHRFDGNVPPNAPDLFGTATETAGRAPAIAYPADNILVPPNLGEFDVHWTDNVGNDLFEVSLHNQYVDLKIYKAGGGSQFTIYSPSEWYSIAASREPLQLTVAGLATGSPAQKGTTVPQTVGVTNAQVQGGVYYWTTQPTQGVYRYDMGLPTTPPSSFFPPGTEPTPCLGCHGLSKDGTKMALTIDSGDGRGTILNVADRSVLVPFNTNAQYWNFATFNPDATKLVTVYHGQLSLRDGNNGAILASIPNSPGTTATHPELSPDGSRLANVETTQHIYDFQVSNGSIVTRTFDASTNTFGPIQMLVPNAPGASNYYPSWSPDGQWIAFTRTAGNSYNDATAEAWVVRSDGSQPPIMLAAANIGSGLTNSWPRWAPFAQSVGANNEPVFYLTFSTTRPFGVRPTGGTQIWMTPFFPDRAAQGIDPSGPAFRMPFQLLTSANHIAQWTQQVVIGKNADGTPLTALQQAQRAGLATP
ncbi:MAG TPA: hypothetical protein VFQ53_27170 [Kofleriaceae bacterium]|nr:hypothetical protein [Kofleriaceae bacterium]